MARGQRQRLAGYLRAFCTRTRKREIFYFFLSASDFLSHCDALCNTRTRTWSRIWETADCLASWAAMLALPDNQRPLFTLFPFPRSASKEPRAFFFFFYPSGSLAICTPTWMRVWGRHDLTHWLDLGTLWRFSSRQMGKSIKVEMDEIWTKIVKTFFNPHRQGDKLRKTLQRWMSMRW